MEKSNKILLLATGSISAPLADKLKRILIDQHGREVETFMTDNAVKVWESAGKEIPKAWTLGNQSFSGECNKYQKTKIVDHIDLVNSNDVCVVCPADFNVVGKMASGIADDFVTSVLAAWLGSGKKIYICEAMNTMMYSNPIHLSNVEKLNRLKNVRFIRPTVKKLACGDYGIGGLADVGTIADIVVGHTWIQPIRRADLVVRDFWEFDSNGNYRLIPHNPDEKFSMYLPRFDEPGAFGAKRKFDRHEGVDIYCNYGASVYAVEDGVVVDSYQYTGSKETGEWWNPTWCLKVKGRSGVVTYGELEMPEVAVAKEIKYPEIGSSITGGQMIGIVGHVLKENKLRADIRHHSTSMLHMELRTECCRLDGWALDKNRDRRLIDPSPYLYSKDILSDI